MRLWYLIERLRMALKLSGVMMLILLELNRALKAGVWASSSISDLSANRPPFVLGK